MTRQTTKKAILKDNAMARHNHTTNAGKHPYVRSEFWANGFYDFLLKPGISDSYRSRILAIKEEALQSVKPLSSKYPNSRK